jgi:hypothetical protein
LTFARGGGNIEKTKKNDHKKREKLINERREISENTGNIEIR